MNDVYNIEESILKLQHEINKEYAKKQYQKQKYQKEIIEIYNTHQYNFLTNELNELYKLY